MKQQTEILFRQISMLRMIPKRSKLTASQIHQALEDEGYKVDLRTVQRDLKTFADSGLFPLTVDDRSKPHGWHWQTDAVIEIPSMTSAEALAFVMFQRHLQDVFPPGLLGSIEPYVKHAEQVLQRQSNQRLARWSDKIAIVPRAMRLIPAKVDEDIHERIAHALLQEKRIDVIYQPCGREARAYVLNPLALVVRDSATYLVASANDYDDALHFALHRFHSVEVSTQAARIPPGFSLKQHLQTQAFDFPLHDETMRLVALFDSDRIAHLHETPLSEDQTLEPYDTEREKLTATAKDTLELRWWLLGFGEGVEIVEPVELRQEFAETAARLGEIYQRR
jgi:predicted DNA-binding transcriptional regulator YafY